MPNIRHEVLIKAPAENVYDAISTEDGLRAWWTPGAIARPELHSIARFPFAPPYFKEMKIVQLIPFKQVKWVCIAGTEEWLGTTISFKLQPGDKEFFLNQHHELTDQVQQQHAFDNGTLLIFYHDDWKENTPMFDECNYTWGQFLKSLKLFCETGRGRPWPNQHRG